MPENWKTYKLGKITSVITKGTTPSTYGFGFEDSGINYIKAESLNYSGDVDENAFVFISEEAHERLKRSQLQPNDILFSMAGAYLGKVGLVKESYCPANTNQAVGIIRINNSNMNVKFVQYTLRNPSMVAFVNAQSGQSAQPNINLSEIGALSFKAPSLPEQRAIASILSALDDKIENNLAMNKTLEAMAMALYKHWFVDFEPFQDGNFIDSEMGPIPEGWEVKRLDEIVEVKRGGSPRPIRNFLAEHGLHWLKISDATAANSPFLYSTKEYIIEEGLRKTIMVYPGSIILSNSATPGLPRLIEFETCIHDGWLHFPTIDRFDRYILYLLFLNIKEHLIQQGNGSVFTNLKTEILKSQLIRLPPLNIEKAFSSRITPWFEKIKENTEETQTLTNLRDTLLPKLISGEVRVKACPEDTRGDIEKTVSEVL